MQALPGAHDDGPGALLGVPGLGGHKAWAGHVQHDRPGEVLPGDAQEVGQ